MRCTNATNVNSREVHFHGTPRYPEACPGHRQLREAGAPHIIENVLEVKESFNFTPTPAPSSSLSPLPKKKDVCSARMSSESRERRLSEEPNAGPGPGWTRRSWPASSLHPARCTGGRVSLGWPGASDSGHGAGPRAESCGVPAARGNEEGPSRPRSARPENLPRAQRTCFLGPVTNTGLPGADRRVCRESTNHCVRMSTVLSAI